MTEHDVRTRVWRNGTLEAENFPFEQVSDYLAQPDCLVWADLCAPDHERIQSLAEELTLDPHAVEDAVSHRERPKVTRYPTHVFMTTVAVRFERDTGGLSSTQLSAFILKNGVVTVSDSHDFDIQTVVDAWDDNSDLIKFGNRALLHGMLDVVVDGYFTAIQDLDDEVESIEDILFEDRRGLEGDVQKRTFALRKSMVQARRAILPMREVVNAIMRHEQQLPDSAALEPYYNDLYDHVLRAAEWTESLRDMISSIFETNLSLADSRLNTIMKKLTSWAAIIAVPTAITGFYGQNIPYPGFGKQWGFWVSLILTLGIAGGLYAVYRKKDWL